VDGGQASGERRLYFGYIGMGQYLNGIAAGHATKTKKIGFVAAKPIPQVLLNINSFLLGARAVDPTITCQVIFTGEWSLAVKEAEATNALADAGLRRDHLPCRRAQGGDRDGRGARLLRLRLSRQPERACAREIPDRGRMELGQAVYTDMVETTLAGGTDPNFVRGGLAEDFIKMSPAWSGRAGGRSRAVRGDQGRDPEGRLRRDQGAAEGQSGNVIAAEGQAFVETDVALESMGYLVEGVIGSTS
jgi:basic membrane protein A and related proteins